MLYLLLNTYSRKASVTLEVIPLLAFPVALNAASASRKMLKIVECVNACRNLMEEPHF